MNMLFWLVVAAVVVHGLVAGISFDVATVKLPTRKRIGVIAYARFARGNDMGNGIVVYPTVAILALLLVAAATLTARPAAERSRTSRARRRRLRTCSA